MELEPLSAADAVFEEELQRNPYHIKTWVAYAESKPAGPARLTVYERAVGALPGSFKLWAAYLTEALKLVRVCERAHAPPLSRAR
jgi:pre-mRNA-splicing factor SYF1